MEANAKAKVVIFGRANVGKSSLFNRLCGRDSALVADLEGTTRDANIGTCEWRGLPFELIDTGGIIDPDIFADKRNRIGDIDKLVQIQARDMLKQADLVIFVTDARAGLLPYDSAMAAEMKKYLRARTSKAGFHELMSRVILVANKSDSPSLRAQTAEFNRLALGEPMPVSAATGSGTGDLLDEVIDRLRALGWEPDVTEPEKAIRVSVIGQPNVGKSSLINAILGEQRLFVSAMPHTTREPHDIIVNHEGTLFNFVDTAGLTKSGTKSRRSEGLDNVEKKSMERALSTLRRAEVALFVFDVSTGLTHQDTKLVQEILDRRPALIIVANKWDLVEDKDTVKYTQYIRDNLPFAQWAPIQFISAKTGAKVPRLLELIKEVYAGRQVSVSDNALTRFLGQIVKRHKPVKARGTKHPHIYELRQKSSNPPRFLVRVGSQDTLHFSYIRYIENRLRDKFGFTGTPIALELENKRRVHGVGETLPDGQPKPKKKADRRRPGSIRGGRH